MPTKPQTTQQRPDADAPSAARPAPPADGPGGVVAVVAASDAGPGGRRPAPTTRSRAKRGADEAGGAGNAQQQSGASGGKGQRRTHDEVGGTPQVRVPPPLRGASASATNHPDNSISPADHNISSGDYIPFSEVPHISAENPNSHPTISIHIVEESKPELPPPGTMFTQPKLGKMHGKDVTGKTIPHERDEVIAEAVSKWVACGAGDNEIAGRLGIRVGQLRKYYKHELENGKFDANMQVGETILNLAVAGVPQMSIFWAKARMGWSDGNKNDQNNAGLLNIHIHN